MRLEEIKTNKKRFLDLLLLADEKEALIDLYLDRGTLYVLNDDGVKAVCVVSDEGNGVLEIQNLAVSPSFHRQGYGQKVIELIEKNFQGKYKRLRVGTGDSPLTIYFYEKCGFTEKERLKNFIIEHYDRPIFECGKQLIDKVVFEKNL